jgi:hypothetical protein
LSRDASIILEWGDGSHLFRLGWGELAKLQEACNAGPFVIMQRLQDGTCRLEDIEETIRWGLIGGGRSPVEATRLCKMFVQGRPPAENRMVAYAAMMAGCLGAPEEQIEKKSEAPSQDSDSTISQTGSSGSEHSTH